MSAPRSTKAGGGELTALLVSAALGGAAGSACRAGASLGFAMLELPEWGSRMAVNVVGACLAGMVVARMAVQETSDPLGRTDNRGRFREHLVITGFLGGLTTVSGFAWDVSSFVDGRSPDAPRALDPAAAQHLAEVLACNAVVGVAAAAVGVLIGARLRRTSGPPRTLRA